MKTITLTKLFKIITTAISLSILVVFSTVVYGLDSDSKINDNSIAFSIQNVNLPVGSVIIDMGVVPQTIENGIKPYGLVHTLLKYYSTPVIWSINPSKVKDGIDFTVDGKDFRGGPFIVSKEFLNDEVISEINLWEAKGVVTYTTQSSASVPLYRELTFGITWVLNEINDGIAEKYLQNAEIPESDYYTSLPSGLTSCEDIFIIPHADPDWEGFGNPLLNWNESIANGGNSGWIWAGCQAVSNLEGDFDPTNSNIRTNFLAETPAIYPGEFDGFGLINHGDHKDASGIEPYLNDFPTDPLMQFIGRTDGAHDGGSEQIYLPYPTGNWRSTTKVAVWDPNQENVLDGDSPGKAALIAYGRAFGDSSRGMVLYEGGHELKNGTEAENVAAQRVFFNFSLEAPAEKAPVILDNGSVPSTIASGESIQLNITTTASNGNPVTYEWSSSSFGTFNNISIANPIFTAGFVSSQEEHMIRVKVTDSCGRISFRSWVLQIIPYIPPTPTPRECGCAPFHNNSNFVNPQLISGTNLSVGAVYRFSNVFPNGPLAPVDALVRIEEFDGGASLLNIDVTSSGLQEAFQPRINSTNSNDQSVLFNITFVSGGGNYGDEVVISYFATPFDIDGNASSNTREYGEISLPDAYYVSNNTMLNIFQSADVVRGEASNTTQAPGGDVSLDPTYTFSNYFENKSTFNYRIGKIDGDNDRYYSLDMNQANYQSPNSVLVTYPVICGNVSDVQGNPLANVTIDVTGSDGSSQTVTTDASGNYKAVAEIPEIFVDVNYQIRENDPSGYISVSDVDGANDNLISRTINLASTCGNDFVDGVAPTINVDDKTDILCNGESTGEISVLADGGVPPYQFSVNGGTLQSSPVFTGLPAGNYTIELTDSLGNTASTSITLLEPEALSVNITKENATTDQGCQNGSATATVGGGTAPYTYLWSASAGGQTTETATNLPDGTHTVTITDANDCVLIQGVVIDCSNTCDQIVTIDSVTDILCTGDNTGSTTVSASSGYDSSRTFTFTWNTTPQQIDSGVTSSTLTGLTAGIYTVSVTIDGTVCLPVEESVTIVEPANALNVSATATDESGPTTGDGTATAIATGGTPPYTYSWSPGGETTEGITGLSAGDYTVTVTDANGCTAVANTTVNPGSCQNLSVTATATSATCNGDSDGTATANVTGGSGSFTYSWSPGGATTQTITGLEAGSYVVTITDSVTQCTVQATATINEPNELTSGIAISNVLCFGGETGSLDLTVSGGTFPYTFAWDNGATTEDIDNLPAGTYSVTITDVNGCVTTDTATIVQPDAGLELTTSVVDVLCTGESTGSIELTVTGGTPPYFFAWNNGETTEDISNIPAGSYNVTITDASGCQLNENGIVVNEPTNPLSVNITKENATTDQGCQNGSATATVGGGTAPYTYLWSASAGGQTTETATNLPDGTHTVTITDANDCVLIQGVVIDCSNTCDQIVTIDSVTDILCTGDNTGSTTVSASSGYDSSRTFTFTWNTTPQQIDSGVTSSTLTGLTAGIYTVSVTIDGTVCLPVEESVTIVEPANALNVSATATDESGPTTGDGTATAIATGGTPPYTYSWSPGGETTEGITGLSAGDYTVTVTDANGCTAVANTTVNPGSCQNLSVTATATSATCNGDSDGTATANVTGGSGSFTYSWSPGGATTQTITGLEAGSYVVTITDSVTQCTVQATATINEPNELTSGIAISNVLCFGGETGSLDLTVSGGTFPYTFAWDNGATTEDIDNLPAGTYSVTITDVNGCVSTDTATIVQPDAALTASITEQIDNICTSGLGSVIVEAFGGTVPYSFSLNGGAFQNTGEFSNLESGSYTINIIDAQGCNTNVSVSILENCTDAENDINTTFEDTSVVGNVLTNDTDAEGDTQTVTTTTVTTAEGVVVTIDPTTGEYVYTPPVGFVGEDSFEYTICDDGNPQACDTATVYIEVLPVGGPENEAPIANADTAGTEEGTPVDGNVLVNDYDPDGDPIVVTTTTVTTAEGVVVTIDPNTGDYTYTPPAGFTGDDSFEYTICDNGNPALCDTAIVVITVTPDNGNSTVANDDAYNTTPGATVSGNVLDNDSDPEGDVQTVNTTPVDDVDNGTLVLNADGTFSYVPNDGFTGTDSFVYSVCDDGTPQACDQATVYITVGGTGNTTDAENDINTTFEDTSVVGNVLTNDTDAEGDTQTVTTTTVTTAEGVVVTIDPTTGEYVYTPPVGFVGEDSFEYTICDDGNPQACDTATVYIEVLPVGGPENEAPIANADTAGTEEGTPVDGNVLVNDYDPDGDPIVVTTTTVTTAEGVVVTIDPNTGDYTYTPPAGFTGDDSFEYTICDNGNPALCDTAIVVITVTPDNGNSTVANDDAYNTTPGATVSGNVLDNDSDPEGDVQTVNTTPVDDVDNGTLVLNADGTFSYVPNDGFTGTDSFVYSVCDDGTPQACDQATVYITVGGTGNTTDAENDINTTFEDTSVVGNVLTNDTDAEGDTQTVTTTTVTTAEGVVVTIDPTTGEYVYTPPVGFVGEDSFEYTICDDGNPQACDTATVYIEVLPVGGPENEAPIANADTAGTEEGTPVDGNVLVNDYDPDGDPIVVTTTTVTTAEGVVVTIDPNTGDYTYTPPAGFTGDDSFEYTICDNGNPALCDTAIVVITVTPDNGNSTVANDDAYNTTPGATVSGNVLDNDSDPEGDVQTVNTTPVDDVDNGTLVLNADGTFSYVPNDGFTGTDSFVYSVCDDGTPQACDQATVYITVGGTGNTTDAENDINTTFEDTSVVGNVLTNDTDAEGDTQTVTTTTVTTAEGVVVTIDPTTGEYVYTPPVGFVGEDSFEYTICDDGNPQACDTATVYIEVLPVGGPENEAPIANADTAGTEEGTPVDGNVLVNDYDPDGDPIVVTTTTVTTAEGVVVTIDPNTGDYTYTPPAGFTGDDSFEYTICDNGNPALCDTAIVVITVTPDNGNSTVANDDAYLNNTCDSINGNVLDNDSDPEGDVQTVNTTPVDDVDNGTLVLNADGTFSYVPNDGFTGTDSFVYSVCDDGTPQACDQATVYITIPVIRLPEVVQGASLCAVDETESQIFDLFELLIGDNYDTSGTWQVVSGDATIINNNEFDPTSVELIGENASEEITFSYTFPNSSCSVEATLEVHNRCAVLACGDEDVVVSKVITPNGDLYNEFFEILGIEDCDYVIDLKIVNRWGAIVFESNDYQNNWNGFVLNGSLGSADQVPSGTYYYIVILKNSGLKPISGPVYIGTK